METGGLTNAEKILQELDRQLKDPVPLTLYGRAAFSLGFPEPEEEFGLSLDVDAILQVGQAERLLENTNFWEAIERTNERLAPDGLYVSHLFTEDQVILTADWFDHRLPIDGAWQHLILSRLSDEDLLLSKLMRDDPHDFGDALYIVNYRGWDTSFLESLFEKARIPNLPEIEEEFSKASSRLLKKIAAH